MPRKIFDAENNLRVARPKSAEADDDFAGVVAVNFLRRAVYERAINLERNKIFRTKNFFDDGNGRRISSAAEVERELETAGRSLPHDA